MMDRNDIFAAVGLVMLGCGLGLVNMAMALCVVGGLLLAIGVAGAWLKGGRG